jgi:type VI secretion system protein ImpL
MSEPILIWLLVALILLILLGAAFLDWRHRRAKIVDDDAEDTWALDPAVFGRAIDKLYGQDDRRNRYEVPCALVCAERTGSAAAVLAAAELEAIEGSGKNGSGWWRSMDGTAFVLPDDAMQNETDKRAGWRAMFGLFDRYRPQRAFDSLVWIIPIDLLDPTNTENDKVLDRIGSAMCQRLFDLQTRLGLQLPVYVVISGCECVPGFAGFAGALPNDLRQQALGWSNPYSIGRTFDKAWVVQGIGESLQTLRRLIAELGAQIDLGDHFADVYLLPDQLDSRLQRLPDLLQAVLRRNATLESFNLRGIHLVGSAHDTGTAMQTANLYAPIVAASTAAKSLFCRDLFARRIFAEFGLATVVKRKLAANRQLYQRVIWGTSAVALVWTLCAIVAHYFAFQNARSMLEPLALLNSQLSNSVEVTTQEDTVEALHQIDSVEDWNLASIFMPLSWAGPLNLDNDIQTILRNYHEKVLFKSIDAGLQQQANNLLTMKPANSGLGTPPASLDQMPEFVTLTGFVDQTIELERRRKQFLTLIRPDRGTTSDLSDLLIYLFRVQPAARSAQSQREFNEIIRRSSYQPQFMRDSAQLSHQLSQHLSTLHEAWLNRLFRDNRFSEMITRLETRLEQFNHGAIVEKEDLTALQREIGDLRSLLARANLSWMADDTRVAESYLKMLAKIEQSELIGKSPGANALKASTLVAQQQFSQTINDEANGDDAMLDFTQGKSLQLTPDVIALDAALGQLLRLSFVQQGGGHEAVLPPGSDQLVAWDPRDLANAQSSNQQYLDYVAKDLPKAPARFQPALQRIAAGQLSRQVDLNLNHAIATTGPNLSWRNNGYDAAQIPVATLIDGLRRIDQDSVAKNWDEVMRRQSSLMLQRVDDELERNAVYQADPHKIAAWSGQKQAAMSAYGLASPGDVQDYLARQIELVTDLANSSKTARSWLDRNNVNLPSGMLGVDDWKHIDAELVKYAAKSPTSSVKTLEQLIGTDLNDIDLTNCHDKLSLLLRSRDTDFFEHRAQQLLRQFSARCQFLQLDRAQAAYNAIRRYYDTRLHGLYPFASKQDAPPADPDTVAGFLALLDRELGYARNGLRAWAPSESAPLQFIDQLDAMRPLLGAILSRDTVSGSSATIELTPEFRINRPREKAGERIMEWKIDTGASGSGDVVNIAAVSKPPVLNWKLGTPIVMSLRWAKDGDVAPTYDSERFPGMMVTDKVAIWNYPDRWALLHLLADHAVSNGDVDSRESTQPQMLKFVVPTRTTSGASAGDAIVYSRLGITLRGKSDRLSYPFIPTGLAPPLSATVARNESDGGM